MNDSITRQEILDRVWSHLRQQAAKSIEYGFEGGYSCLYRSSKGLKCAIGCLIEDSEYSHPMEGRSISTLIADRWTPRRLTPHSDLLQALQNIHDNMEVGEWEKALIDLHTINTWRNWAGSQFLECF